MRVIWLLLAIFGMARCHGMIRSTRHIKRSMFDADPCLKVNSEENTDKIVFPEKFQSLQYPWVSKNTGVNPKVYKGEGIDYQWVWMKSLIINGFKSKSIEDMIQFLNKQGCLFIPAGPFVRDLILRNQPVHLSGEVSCNISTLYSECKIKFGSKMCALYPIEHGGWGDFRLEIGDANVNSTLHQVRAEPISLYGWNTITGQKPTERGYTVDALALYDDGAGTVYIIDLTGNGFTDTCDKKLVPTVKEDQWNEWSDGQMLKVLEFYDLRVNGFSVSNSEFQTFVNEKLKNVDKSTAQTFYCEHILKGVVNLGQGTTVCHTLYPEKESSLRIKNMRELMIKEMGREWKETIGSSGDEMEAIFCTKTQFVDVRNKLKKKIQSEDVSAEDPEFATRKIVDGKPMIEDMSDIHKRPILGMSEELPQLPVEHPSKPIIKLNEKLEFVEVRAHPEGAGYNDPIAYVVSKDDKNDMSFRKLEKSNGTPLPVDDISDEEMEDAAKASSHVSIMDRKDSIEISKETPLDPTASLSSENVSTNNENFDDPQSGEELKDYEAKEYFANSEFQRFKAFPFILAFIIFFVFI